MLKKNRIIKKLKKTFKCFLRLVKEIPAIFKVLKQESYFPEKERKSKWAQLSDNVSWLIKYNEANTFYQLYGLDTIGSKASDFIDNQYFMFSRNRLNKINCVKSQVILLRDKFLFYKYISSHKIPVPEVFGFYQNGFLFDNTFKPINPTDIKNETNFFIKEIDGECASFVKKMKDYNSFLEIKDSLSKGSYIFQKGLTQSPEMSKINPEAINTLRIVTVNNNNHIEVLSALLRIGTKITGNVDNWAKGGIAIGVQKNGFLKKYGFFKPSFGKKISAHPDTNIEFEKFQIPHFQEALDLACNAHKVFYGIHSIGWDIAFSTDGLMIIEGNDNWEISLMQACDHGLRKEWLDQTK